jgi:uncharacterized protein YcnI
MPGLMGRNRMKRRRVRVAAVTGAALVAFLTMTSSAFAHASLSPAVAETGVLQQFTLAVPTEKEGATTTEIRLTVPAGVAIDSFEPEPGWKRAVSASGSGDAPTVNTITWSGGAVPTDEDSVFRFQATLTGGSKTYTFGVRQTYSDGSVVEWTGAENSDTPSPVIKGVSSIGGSSNSTLAIIAIVVAVVALMLAGASLLSGRRSLT